MRSILVHLDSGAAADNRVQAALAIARRTRGHVTAHANTPVQGLVAFDPFGGAYPMAAAIAAARSDTDTLIAAWNDRLARDDVPFSVESSETDLITALAQASRLADLVVVDLDDVTGFSRPRTSQVGGVAVAGSAPVLALCPGTPFALDGIAVIAWNDSRESSAALRAAVPLLALAKAVHVVRIGQGEDVFDAAPALEYLSRHDVHAELHSASHDGITVEEAIEREAQNLNADWIVMGAYSRSRWSEYMFGGVTRYMLESARFPLFLAH